MKNTVVSFIGAGSMAEAIIAGMTAKEIVPTNHIIATNYSNKERLQRLEEEYQIQTTQNRLETVEKSNVVILAMKPKDIQSSLNELDEVLTENHIVVSLLAGISSTYIESLLHCKAPVIRVMPNTSATIGRSATTIAKGTYVEQEHIDIVDSLMTSIGMTAIIDEEKMDAYTALAGSAPAFYYYMVEAMEQFAKEKGLSLETAKPLMIETIRGVGEMLASTKEKPEILRKKITSPGGTTEAGIQSLSELQFKKAVIKSLNATANRSQEMRRELEK